MPGSPHEQRSATAAIARSRTRVEHPAANHPYSRSNQWYNRARPNRRKFCEVECLSHPVQGVRAPRLHHFTFPFRQFSGAWVSVGKCSGCLGFFRVGRYSAGLSCAPPSESIPRGMLSWFWLGRFVQSARTSAQCFSGATMQVRAGSGERTPASNAPSHHNFLKRPSCVLSPARPSVQPAAFVAVALFRSGMLSRLE